MSLGFRIRWKFHCAIFDIFAHINEYVMAHQKKHLNVLKEMRKSF